MKLLDTKTYELVDYGSQPSPHYAVLSHTWLPDDQSVVREITYQDITTNQKMIKDGNYKQQGWSKLRKYCDLAAADGWKHAWMDTCCIDKTNPSDTQEAINAMFRWYQNATICYTYLEDKDISAHLDTRRIAVSEFSGNVFQSLSKDNDFRKLFREARWFTRGWTLQELLAPIELVFVVQRTSGDQPWQKIGNRAEWKKDVVNACKMANVSDLENFADCPIARKLSWASFRETTREEDQAYSLLGLFGISLPLCYGEGRLAFQRFQLELARSHSDSSLFAWFDPEALITSRSYVFAPSIKAFRQGSRIKHDPSRTVEYCVDNRGVVFTADISLLNFQPRLWLSCQWEKKMDKLEGSIGLSIKPANKIDPTSSIYSGDYARTEHPLRGSKQKGASSQQYRGKIRLLHSEPDVLHADSGNSLWLSFDLGREIRRGRLFRQQEEGHWHHEKIKRRADYKILPPSIDGDWFYFRRKTNYKHLNAWIFELTCPQQLRLALFIVQERTGRIPVNRLIEWKSEWNSVVPNQAHVLNFDVPLSSETDACQVRVYQAEGVQRPNCYTINVTSKGEPPQTQAEQQGKKKSNQTRYMNWKAEKEKRSKKKKNSYEERKKERKSQDPIKYADIRATSALRVKKPLSPDKAEHEGNSAARCTQSQSDNKSSSWTNSYTQNQLDSHVHNESNSLAQNQLTGHIQEQPNGHAQSQSNSNTQSQSYNKSQAGLTAIHEISQMIMSHDQSNSLAQNQSASHTPEQPNRHVHDQSEIPAQKQSATLPQEQLVGLLQDQPNSHLQDQSTGFFRERHNSHVQNLSNSPTEKLNKSQYPKSINSPTQEEPKNHVQDRSNSRHSLWATCSKWGRSIQQIFHHRGALSRRNTPRAHHCICKSQ